MSSTIRSAGSSSGAVRDLFEEGAEKRIRAWNKFQRLFAIEHAGVAGAEQAAGDCLRKHVRKFRGGIRSFLREFGQEIFGERRLLLGNILRCPLRSKRLDDGLAKQMRDVRETAREVFR